MKEFDDLEKSLKVISGVEDDVVIVDMLSKVGKKKGKK